MFLTGVLQSFGMVILNSIGFIFFRLVSTVYDVNPILYTVVAFMTTSIALSLVAGPGKYAMESIKSKGSWFYSLFLVSLCVFQLFLVKYVSGTEGALFNNMSIPMTMILAAFILKRSPTKTDILGMFLVCVSLFMTFNIQSSENMTVIVSLAVAIGVCKMLMTVCSETHVQSNTANKEAYFRDQIRVVAFVSFIASMMFLVVSLGASVLKTYYLPESITQYLAFLPDIHNFVNLPTVLFGIFMGILVIPLNRYFKWSAAYKIKSENVLCILAITPMFTLFAEWLLSFLPFFKSNLYIFEGERGLQLIAIVILSIIGAGLPIFRKVYKNYKKLKATGLTLKQQVAKAKKLDKTALAIKLADDNKEDYEVILATVNHCQNNLIKAAEMLDIPVTTLKVIYEGQGEYVLNEETSLLINKNFREKVVLSDSLTGLANRTALMAALEKLYNQKICFALVFMDLNKFKAINDNHGHDAGDAALVEFAKRLETFLDGNCYSARFAGDEFCILIPVSKSNIGNLLEELKQHVLGKFDFDGETLELLASFGLAHSKDYPTALQLLDSADDIMFKDKDSSR